MKEYQEQHQLGTIFVENMRVLFPEHVTKDAVVFTQSDIGVQIAPDGRIWVCINGVAFIRFSPHPDGKMSRTEPGVKPDVDGIMMRRSGLNPQRDVGPDEPQYYLVAD